MHERKLAESGLQKALSYRDEFLSIASHELKTPLTSLKLQMQVTKRRMTKLLTERGIDEPLTDLQNSIHDLDRLTELVEDLLDVSRIKAGRLTFEFGRINVNSVLQNVVDRLSDQLESANCSVSIDAPEFLQATWDQGRIVQVLINLLTNAVKYAPGGPITIKVAESNGRIEIAVSDSGPGIPAERRATIFERYERVSPLRNISGLGLGLFIVKNIIEGHGGTVRAEEAETGGARIVVELPKQAAI